MLATFLCIFGQNNIHLKPSQDQTKEEIVTKEGKIIC